MLNPFRVHPNIMASNSHELDKAMRIYRTHHLFGKDGITGLGRTKFFEALKNDDFPEPNVNYRDNPNDSDKVKPIHGWTSDLVEAWIESKRDDKPQHDVKE